MRSPPRLTGLATELPKIAGHAQGCDDGKILIEDSLCGNELRHLMAANRRLSVCAPNAAELLIWIIKRCPESEPEHSGTIANYCLQADKFDGKSDGKKSAQCGCEKLPPSAVSA